MARIWKVLKGSPGTGERALAEGERLWCLDLETWRQVQAVTDLDLPDLGVDLVVEGVELEALDFGARLVAGDVELGVLGSADPAARPGSHPALEALLKNRGGVLLETEKGGAIGTALQVRVT